MTRIRLTAAEVAGVRFTTSATWETVASVHAVTMPSARQLHRSWRRDIDAQSGRAIALLATLQQVPGWLPDSLAVAPSSGAGDGDDLDRVLQVPMDVVERDLAVLTAHGVRPWVGMRADEMLAWLHRCLRTIWTRRVEPVWEAILDCYDVDLARQAGLVTRNGVGAVLDGLHPDVSFDGDSLDARFPGCASLIAAAGRDVVLVPSVFRWPHVTLSVDVPGPVVLGYPAQGAHDVWRSRDREDDGLGPLLGVSRAALLRDLGVRRTTTELARRHQLAPATVSAHLSVMSAARLVSADRQGRHVYYAWSTLGARLVGDRAHDQRAG